MISMNKTELGDFQTPDNFCEKVVNLLSKKYRISPKTVLEPTMGLGNFIAAALKEFPEVQKIAGLDIEERYVKSAKERFLDFKFSEFICANAFSYNFDLLNSNLGDGSLLCIGNPPWVTNSQLSSVSSFNIPKKSNKIRRAKGVDAITGKSNFDIAEYILLQVFNSLKSRKNTIFAFLVKSIVARNIFKYKSENNYKFSIFDVYHFDAKKIFNVSCDAVLLVCQFTDEEGIKFATEFDFDTPNREIKKYGYYNGIFVSNIDYFSDSFDIIGKSKMTWRQGVKHDCSSVMELTLKNGKLMNKLDEDCTFLKDNERVFPLVKSSEIKGGINNKFKHFVIVTQDKVGDDTCYLAKFPELYSYLLNHKGFFDARKSIIYKKAAPFAIFGIGEYSFTKYKIAISGLYKQPHFTYLSGNKPVMTDDTCYFIGTNLETLSYLLFVILDNPITYRYLASIAFSDSKRPFTKDVLQNIDLKRLSQKIGILNIVDIISEKFAVQMDKQDVSDLISAL